MVLAEQKAPAVGKAEDEGEVVLLASAAAEGDERAFADLYHLLSQRIFNLVLRSVHDRPTAEDLCQEIWLRAHEEIRTLRAPQAVRSWLYRIASRACVDFARSSRGRHRREEDDIDDFVIAYGPQPEDAAIVDSEVRFVWETLGAMAPRQSMALYLKQIDGLTYAEIASILECTPPSVEALLFRARQSFARAYHRMESSALERCEMFSQVMASVVDHEPTQLQRTALEAHAAGCRSCRSQLSEIRRANRAYLALPLLPIGKGLALETILAGGGATAGAGLLTAAAGLLGAGAFQAKIVLVGAIFVAGGAVATGQVSVPVVSGHVGVTLESRDHTLTMSDPGGAHGAGASGQALPSLLDDRVAPIEARTGSGVTSPAVASGAAGITEESMTADRQDDSATPVAAESLIGPAPAEAPDVAEGQPAPPAGPLSSEFETGPEAPIPTPAPDAPAAQGTGPTPGGDPEESAAPQGLITSVLQTTEDVTRLAGEAINEVAELVGDTVGQVVAPVVTVIQPLDDAVEDLTGLSLVETLEDVTSILPSSSATAVPLNEVVQDVIEPVGDLLDDPLQPVEELLEDPLEPLEELTGPLLEPLLPTPPPEPSGTPPPDPTTPPANEGPCLLGLLLC